jgi:Uma2 family endonuclease
MATTTISREHADQAASAADEQLAVWPYRWTREQYDLMVEHGILGPGNRVQLIEGDIVEMAPLLEPHALAIGLAQDLLPLVFGAGFHVRVQSLVALGERSEPEPDVAVVRGGRRDYFPGRPGVPGTLALALEVSDSTLPFDRNQKASMYAKEGVLDYWILNVRDRQLEVQRVPEPMPEARYGYGYRERFVVPVDGEVAPLAAPDKLVKVADLLP